jgi:hypothetical protein
VKRVFGVKRPRPTGLLIDRSQFPTSSDEATDGHPAILIGLGLVILIVGIVWPIFSRIGLGRLPGDILIQRGGTGFYFPLVTCIIVSIALSALF